MGSEGKPINREDNLRLANVKVYTLHTTQYCRLEHRMYCLGLCPAGQ